MDVFTVTLPAFEIVSRYVQAFIDFASDSVRVFLN